MNKEIKKLKDRIHALEEHNKHLDLEAQIYFDAIMNNVYLEEENEELQERIVKAIEYITSEECIDTFKTIESRENWLKINHNLLDILEGEDNE